MSENSVYKNFHLYGWPIADGKISLKVENGRIPGVRIYHKNVQELREDDHSSGNGSVLAGLLPGVQGKVQAG